MLGDPGTVRVTEVKGQLPKLMCNKDWLRLRIGSVMLRLTPLLIWAGVISLRRLWMRDGPCSMFGKSGTPLSLSCIVSWLRFPGFVSIMMNAMGQSRGKQRPRSFVAHTPDARATSH